MMMVFATLIAAFLGFFLYLRSDKRDTKAILRPSWFFPVLAGACNALLNLFIILLGTSLPLLSSSLVFPVVSVGGLAVVMLFSLFVFREKLKWWQWLGIAVGAVATVLLSL
jgi:drug/metabolite transporter (DMT)-like permease